MSLELLKKFEEVLKALQNSKDFQEYQKAQAKLSKNKEITALIAEIKTLQKAIVQKEYQGIDKMEEELLYREKVNKLNQFPLYQEYRTRQKNVNEMLQYIKSRIEGFFDQKTKSNPNP